MTLWYEKYIKVFLLCILISWFALFLLQKIDLTNSDIGRHIKNGEVWLKNAAETGSRNDLLHTNFYSYTQSKFPFVNHHWGSGVFFYLIYKVFGFSGLSVFYVFLGILTFLLFFDVARRISGFYWAILISIPLIPLMTARVEVRPEMFTYFFTGLFLWILWLWKKRLISVKVLFLLPLLFLIWINLHIGFIFGLFIFGVFLLDELIFQRFLFFKNSKMYILLVSVSFLVLLINPFGLKGVLFPLNIFKNYGYLIVENQSIQFLEKLGMFKGLNFTLFKLTALVLILSFMLTAVFIKKQTSFLFFTLSVFFAVISYLGIRNFPLMGLITLPALSYNFSLLHQSFSKKLDKELLTFFVILVLSISVAYQANLLTQKWPAKGLGVYEGNQEAAKFFIQNNLKGPIFNNYDIGGYLIYYLYPWEQVFVDNRPEAYSIEFFKKSYIPAQENPVVWQEIDEQYNFNAIFFSHRDYTPWGQAFLVSTVDNSDWAPVYVDSYAIIFLKRNELNKEVIAQYEMPKNTFKVVKN